MRIVALEKEIERYKTQLEPLPVQNNTECSAAELLQKIDTLEKVCLFGYQLSLTSLAKQDIK